MKNVIGVSLGSHRQDFEFETSFLGQAMHVRRLGTDGSGAAVLASERATFEWAYGRTGLSGAESGVRWHFPAASAGQNGKLTRSDDRPSSKES